MDDPNFFSEGWIAALGATCGAVILKIAERLLQNRKQRFDETITEQTRAQTQLSALWARLDTLQRERDELWTRLRTADDTHTAKLREAYERFDQLQHRYQELETRYHDLRAILRDRHLQIPDDRDV